jgi:hypothetical protein
VALSLSRNGEVVCGNAIVKFGRESDVTISFELLLFNIVGTVAEKGDVAGVPVVVVVVITWLGDGVG